MITLQSVTYTHPNKDLLFDDLNLVINKNDKIALIGNNGAGKSTLLKILAGHLYATSGQVKAIVSPYYVPQLFGQYNHYSIARALGIENKLNALNEIIAGNTTDENFNSLNDDWTIEERCKQAFEHWKLDTPDLNEKMGTLSGGQKTKVFLAGIEINNPQIVLLDEPSNHLDTESRKVLYDYINFTTNTLVVVSHDRALLNMLNVVYELSKSGITAYGGNYDFYANQKAIENNALSQDIKSREKALRKAKETERESMERKQKLDARGKKKQEKAGIPTILMNTLKNNAEKSTSRMKGIHTEKINTVSKELSDLRKDLPDLSKIKITFNDTSLYKGKTLITAKNIIYKYNNNTVWSNAINFQINSCDRIAIKGSNGSGKTTLIKLILGHLIPTSGNITINNKNAIYIDQDYSLINNSLKIYDQAQLFNDGALQEHEIKIRLNRFLFTKEYWDKPCEALSGGEKMRLILCLTIGNQAPDIIILDEPTNNLDIQNIEILTNAIMDYEGTLLVVSHDEYFLKQINIEHTITLN